MVFVDVYHIPQRLDTPYKTVHQTYSVCHHPNEFGGDYTSRDTDSQL
ncbi:hypothetical protein HSB1_44300 [Halogranum salarium B-1]|uniref:Uncharacterized protein n=1 Tax=Halogranum salarium B-1 TaxID=1210908 RepID=J3JCZ5_9EURY|nr:hypothetical protein HSB1_44300 [Halogranum salarium B-1]